MSKKIVFAIHGLGGHSGWFDRLKNELKKFDIGFHAVDLPGFGKNHMLLKACPYTKGHIDDFNQWIDFVKKEYFELKEKNPDAQIIVMGHSLGAVVATCLDCICEGDKLILSVPGYKGADSTFNPGFVVSTLWKLLFDKIIMQRDVYVSLPVSEKKYEDPTEGDPLKVEQVTQTLLFQIMKMGWTLEQAIQSITMPVMLIQIEGDSVVDNETQDKFFVIFPSGAKTKNSYSGADHDWIWSQKVSVIAEDLANWINA